MLAQDGAADRIDCGGDNHGVTRDDFDSVVHAWQGVRMGEWEIGVPSIDGSVSSGEPADLIDRIVGETRSYYEADAAAYFATDRRSADLVTVEAETFWEAIGPACQFVVDEFALVGGAYPVAHERLLRPPPPQPPTLLERRRARRARGWSCRHGGERR
jgi:hypothetical protein